jgi:hypothetical protein
MGHAAGVAAAIALRDRISARDVDTNELRNVLREEGAILDASEAVAPDPDAVLI